jgi:hypothetical protein
MSILRENDQSRSEDLPLLPHNAGLIKEHNHGRINQKMPHVC